MIPEMNLLLSDARRLANLDYWQLNLLNQELIINREHLESLGYSPPEHDLIHIQAQAYLQQYVHPDDTNRLKTWLFASSPTLVQGQLASRSIEFRAIEQNGGFRFLMATSEYKQQSPTTVFGIFQDITTQKKAESELRERELRYSLLMEATDSGVWDWHIQTGQVFNSPSLVRIFGYTPEELTGDILTFEKYLHDADKKAVRQSIEAHLKGEVEFYESTHRMRHKSGEMIWVHHRGRVIEWDENGQPSRMIGSLTDLTERLRMEQTLRDKINEEKIINYFSTSLVGQHTVDEIFWDVANNCVSQLGFTDCVVYMVDEANRKLVQKAAYGHKKSGDFEVFQPIDLPLGTGIVGHVALSGQAEIVNDTSRDNRYIVDDDRRLSEIAVPIVYQNQVIGVIDSEHAQKGFFNENHLNVLTTIASICSNKVAKVMAEDKIKASLQENERLVREQNTLLELKIKERTAEIRQQNKQLSQLNSIKDKLLSIIAHDLRNPLNSLKGLLNLFQLEALSSDEFKVYLLRLNSTLKSTSDLLDNLLTWATAQIQRTEIKPTVVNLQALVAENMELMEQAASEKNIQLTSHLRETDLVLADESMVKLIIRNLLTNAVKFTNPGGRVSISAHPEESTVVLAVEDTGIGITPETQRKLFNISTKFTTYGTHQEKGSGLGLALCKEFVERNGGKIWVESQPGEGSIFRFALKKATADADMQQVDLANNKTTAKSVRTGKYPVN